MLQWQKFLQNAVLTLMLVHLSSTRKKVEEDDNIAVPQHLSPSFILPAPGIRFGSRQGSKFESPPNSIAGLLSDEFDSRSMPTISNLDVACLSDSMQVQISFNLPFNGIIYSKGHYDNPACTYVSPGQGRTSMAFEIRGRECGMQFLQPPGQSSYMENVIIVQNEPGIQEVWDTARGLRCTNSGSLAKSLNRQTVSAAIKVAMLDQQVVSFSANQRASASMDIQVGRGPFAQSASGLVKIGELMTMVVAAEGPPQVDLQVRQCIAHDGSNDNLIELTDQAFKFPDRMDVFIECEVDLCNGECQECLEDKIEFNLRRRRALKVDQGEDRVPLFDEAIDAADKGGTNEVPNGANKSEHTNLKLARRLRVLSPDDISVNGDEYSSITFIERLPDNEPADICLSVVSFVIGIIVIIAILILSSGLTAILCVRVRSIPSRSSSFPPNSSFHAFSTVSGKTT